MEMGGEGVGENIFLRSWEMCTRISVLPAPFCDTYGIITYQPEVLWLRLR